MSEYMLHHEHKAADCELIFKAYAGYDTPLKGNGRTFQCYGCHDGSPGQHGGFIHVEAASEEEALAHLPEVERPMTRAYRVATLALDM